MYLLIIFFPFIGSCFAGLFGKKLGSKGSILITTISLLFSFFFSLFAFYETAFLECFVYIKLITWIDSENLNVDWAFMFDTLTCLMCCIITFVSSIVHLYSVEYMATDPYLSKFMSFLSLFTFFMLILITSDNFVQMFVGWEGVGLCSYLLINFWFTRIQANKAAIKAMVVNRIGDFGLILGILILFINYKAVDYATIFALTPVLCLLETDFLNFKFNIITIAGFLLFIGAIGKSAQLGLHTWLPDAMEGPTPVSALIHAATMVTAGVFLIARCSPLYEFTATVKNIIIIIGALTAFFAATVGLLQNDLKRVIAYSTASQLGYMIFACGLSNYSIGIFHLSNHAFFKALLFLGAGSVIHSVNDEQDIRKMGGLKSLIPYTYSLIVVGSLALIGFPFLTGFYSKDLILEVAFGKFTTVSRFSYYLGTFGAFCTAFYSTRLIYLTFLSKPNGYKQILCYAKDSSYNICISLGLLALPSIFIGFLTKDMFVGLGSHFWGSSIYVSPLNMNMLDSEFIDHFYKLLPVILSIFGGFTAFIFYQFKSKFLFKIQISFFGRNLYNFLNKKWFFDKIYNEQFGQFFFNISYNISYKLIDRGLIELFGPFGFAKILTKTSQIINKLQSGFIYHYTFLFLIGVTFLLSVFQFYNLANQYYALTLDFIKLLILFAFYLTFYIINLKKQS